MFDNLCILETVHPLGRFWKHIITNTLWKIIINLWSVTLPAGNILLSQTVFTCIKVLTLDICICSRLTKFCAKKLNLHITMIWNLSLYSFEIHLYFVFPRSLNIFWFFWDPGNTLCVLLYCMECHPERVTRLPFPCGESADQCRILHGLQFW